MNNIHQNNMKIILINGSPRKNSNTLLALKEVEKSLNEEGIDTEIIDIGNKEIRGCIACGSCHKNGKCCFDDIVNEVAEKFDKADGIVVGSPTYYASTNGTVISFLDRLFYSSKDKTMKVGAAVCTARRAGNDTNFDVINKYFTISNMIVVGSCYWNNVFGREQGECVKDEEGMQTMRFLGKNIAFVVKSINDGKQKYKINYNETKKWTHFIR